MTSYKLAGLRVVSDLILPGLAPCGDEPLAGHDIVVRRASIPETLSVVDVAFPDGQCNRDELLLNVPEVGRYLLRGGKEILIDQAPKSNYGDLCAYLLGTMFGILGHQRGIPPLHASVIDVADGCVAFTGKSGAGKSTLAAALAARGHQVIADDVCFLQLGEKGRVQVWPGVNRIRLWEDAMVALGCDGTGIERELRGYNKYLIPMHPLGAPLQSRRLRRVYQLHAASDGCNAGVYRLPGIVAMEALLANVYRLGLAEYMGFKPAAFAICAATARDVPIFRFSRPMVFSALQKGVTILEEHLHDTSKS